MQNKRRIGGIGESMAERHLERIGYEFVDRNAATPWGEIDLIFLDGPCLVFVEVKFRRSARFGIPEEAITQRKLEHLSNAIATLVERRKWDGPFRLDIIAITKRTSRTTLRHHRAISLDR